MKPVYEIVRADELRVGDIVLDLRYGAAKPYVIDSEIVDIARGAPKNFYPQKVRQLSPERNPDVLERALEITMKMYMGGHELSGASYSIIASNIEQAIRELESEAGDGQ